MNKTVIIGGGAAGMMAAVFRPKRAIRPYCSKKTKNLEKRYI